MQGEQRRFWRGALRPLIALGALLLAFPAQAATRGYTITSFDAIRLEAPLNVVITTGLGPSAKAEGDQALLDRLRVEVSGRLLIVRVDRLEGADRGGGATLRLSTADLRRIILAGGGSISISRMKGLRGEIFLGGNGNVTVESVEVDQLVGGVAGSGRLTLAGKVGDANLRISGPGALEGDALHARQATVSNEGPGNISLTVDVAAKVVSSGSGDVTIAGPAACNVTNSGTGRVLCGGEER
jgi:hypothetical protein